MIDFDPVFNVWIRMGDDDKTWEHVATVHDEEDAAREYSRNDIPGVGVAVYELGAFLHKKKRTVGMVAFIWNEALDEYMQRPCQKRGCGWSDDYDVWVDYDFPGKDAGQQAPVSAGLGNGDTKVGSLAQPPKPVERYVSEACESCGKILPMNMLSRLDHKVETGSTSGTTRRSSSVSYRSNSKNTTSTTRRYGTSRISGRTYFQNETLLLCVDCYNKQKSSDTTKAILRFIGGLLR